MPTTVRLGGVAKPERRDGVVGRVRAALAGSAELDPAWLAAHGSEDPADAAELVYHRLASLSASRTRPEALTGRSARTGIPITAASNEIANCEARIPVEELEPRGIFAEVHHEVAGLVGGPGQVGVCRHAQHVKVAIADLEHE